MAMTHFYHTQWKLDCYVWIFDDILLCISFKRAPFFHKIMTGFHIWLVSHTRLALIRKYTNFFKQFLVSISFQSNLSALQCTVPQCHGYYWISCRSSTWHWIALKQHDKTIGFRKQKKKAMNLKSQGKLLECVGPWSLNRKQGKWKCLINRVFFKSNLRSKKYRFRMIYSQYNIIVFLGVFIRSKKNCEFRKKRNPRRKKRKRKTL